MEKERVLELFKSKSLTALRSELCDENPADIASLIQSFYEDEELNDTELCVFFRMLTKESAAETFSYMDSDIQFKLINALSDKELKEVLDELYLDDTVDIIEEMPANVVFRILNNTDVDTRKQINELLNYPKDSAGSIMTTEFIYLTKEFTVKEALEKIKHIGMAKETVYTCYVTQSRKLIGYVTVLDMLVSEHDTKIEDIMETNVISVMTTEDKENVVSVMSKYDLGVLPVVDSEKRLVGIVTFDDAMDVLQEENTEDIEKMAAITPSDKPYMKTGTFEIYKKRIPWLLLLMISATFTGMIISSFENSLAAVPVLTMFIPMLMDTGGNSGSQSSVTVIRGLSLGDIEFSDILSVVFKEFRVSILCAVTLALAVFLKVLLLDQKGVTIALVVSLTIVAVVIMAKVIGCTLPMIAKKLGFDPAVMASPFITTIVDALALLVYFGVASLFLTL